MKKIIKWTLRIIAGLVLFCLVLSLFLFEKIDRTPYQEMPYYKEMMAQLDTFQLDTLLQKGDYLKAGWAKENITPSHMTEMAGYGLREKANCLHDSSFVRVFVFDNGKNKVAFITLELLIFPPTVAEKLKAMAKELGYSPENLYLTATHSHSAPGGWAEGPAGRLLAGNYKDEYVSQLVSSIMKAIKIAENDLEKSETGFSMFNAKAYVGNRLNMPDSKVDGWIRVLKIRKASGKQAAIVVYSAHATCLKMKYRCFSGDFPSELISKLEYSKKIDFVMYSAGMVGSHAPKPIFQKNVELLNQKYINVYTDSLASIICKGIDSIPLNSNGQMCSAEFVLPLREPHLKISQNWRFRPWVFNLVFGDYNPKIKILKINNILFIGTPCDFSGELMNDFKTLSKEKNIRLVITSFNGGYIGYINADKYYDLDKAETRDMNWFGPYNQAYFTEIIQKILKKI